VHSSNIWLHINNLKTLIVVEEMVHAPMNIATTITFSILFAAAPIALLFASGPLLESQQAFAANNANIGNVGHLYQGGVPGYPYFGGYPNYGGYPYDTGYGHPYDTGYGHPYGGDHSYNYSYGSYTFYHHHHHHHHHHTH